MFDEISRSESPNDRYSPASSARKTAARTRLTVLDQKPSGGLDSLQRFSRLLGFQARFTLAVNEAIQLFRFQNPMRPLPLESLRTHQHDQRVKGAQRILQHGGQCFRLNCVGMQGIVKTRNA